MVVFQMKYSRDIDFFRAILIVLVILVHIVNFGNVYPLAKSGILSFIMPTFLVITGFLVNINKPIQDYTLYILRIWLPYMILVIGYAVLSLFLPVRDGIKVFDIPTILNILFIKSIGPYWFLHAMMVWNPLLFCIPYFRQDRCHGKVFHICILADNRLIVDPFLEYQDGCILFHRSGDKAIL